MSVPHRKSPLLLHAPSTSYYSISLCTRQKPLQELGTGRMKCALVDWEPQVREALNSGVEITEGVGVTLYRVYPAAQKAGDR